MRKFVYITRVDTPYERISSENLREYFRSAAIPTREIILQDAPGQRPELKRCLNSDAFTVIGNNWHLDHSWIGERPFLDHAVAAGIPVIQWMHDHPSTLWPLFQRSTGRNSSFIFHSAYSENYFRRFIVPDGRSGWTAGIGPSQHSRVAQFDLEAFRRREISCLLPMNLRRIGGTLADAQQRLETLPIPFRQATEAAIESTVGDLVMPIEAHFLNLVPFQDHTERPDIFHRCVQIAEEIAQIKRRLEIFETARQFPVLIQSDVFTDYFADPGSATLNTNVDMPETMIRFPRARAVVSAVHANDQIHDRVLNALNAGAVNIIEDNAIHRRFFRHGENALLFRYGDDSLRECLELVCSDPARTYAIAEAAMALRDDPRLRFAGFDSFVSIAQEQRARAYQG